MPPATCRRSRDEKEIRRFTKNCYGVVEVGNTSLENWVGGNRKLEPNEPIGSSDGFWRPNPVRNGDVVSSPPAYT
jgi:hypothetical protein